MPARDRPIDVLTPAEVRQLIDALPAKSWTGLRTRVLIWLMYDAALRCNSARHVRPCDIRAVVGGGAVIHAAKPWARGGHAYTAKIGQDAFEDIKRFLPVRAAQLGSDRPDLPLCCTLAGKAWNDGNIRHRIRDLAARVLPGRRVHPHTFRHSFAHNASLQPNWPIRAISQQLGHRSIATTEQYLHEIRLAESVATAKRSEYDSLETWEERAKLIVKSVSSTITYRDAQHFVEHVVAIGTGQHSQ